MRGISPYFMKNQDTLTDASKMKLDFKQENFNRTQLRSRIANLQRQTELAHKKIQDQQKQQEFVQAMTNERDERMMTKQDFRKKTDLEVQMKNYFFNNQRKHTKSILDGSKADSYFSKRNQSQDMRNFSQSLREQILA